MTRAMQAHESGEVFRFLSASWDVELGHRIAAGRQPNIAVASEYLTDRYLGGLGLDDMGLLHIDKERARDSEEIDTRVPVLAISFPLELGDGLLVIDGWHRVYRAAWLGSYNVPGVLLAWEEEVVVRLAPSETELGHLRRRAVARKRKELGLA